MKSRGFTLIEVLVALGIVAIALIAGLQATQALTTNATRQTDVLLAHLCAENELIKMRLSVLPTPNPSFRRVDAQVFDGNSPILRLSTIVGRF